MSVSSTPDAAIWATSDMKAVSSFSSPVLSSISTHSVQPSFVTAKPENMLPFKSASSHGLPPSDNNNKAGGNMARQKRHSWMRSSVVRRAAMVVDEEVAALCEKSPFLNSLQNNNCDSRSMLEIALFHRQEIQLGKALGRGGFAEVYAVEAFHVDDHRDDGGESLRQACKISARSFSGRPKYAIKFLRKKLLSNTQEFLNAAIDLAVETKYLAALSHPNIIKVRGLTRGGTAAFRTGKRDEFFLIMDHLQETLEHRLQRWQKRHTAASEDDGSLADSDLEWGNPPSQYYHRSMRYAHQIADALAYLHDKSIVYRDLKPSNLGFRERDVIQLFDFGLCRELPKPQGQASYDEDMEGEETFHMSGVGTQRYMSPETLNSTRRYNLKTDVYSLSMVCLEMMTWKKPFWEYSPEEHTKFVAGQGERPKLVTDIREMACAEEQTDDEFSGVSYKSQPQHRTKRLRPVLVSDWPEGMANLLQDAWAQDVAERLTMQAVFDRLGSIVDQFDNSPKVERSRDPSSRKVHEVEDQHDNDDYRLREWEKAEVVLEFPSHFSPRHQLSARSRNVQYQVQQQSQHPLQVTSNDEVAAHLLLGPSKDDSEDRWFGRQSDASSCFQELTMTSASTTLHDSTSTS